MPQREKTKTIGISPKIKSSVKEALVAASEHENRSQANMLEVMILDYCKIHNIKTEESKNERK